MSRVLIAAAAAVVAATAAVAAFVLPGGAATPEKISAGQNTCTTDSNGYCFNQPHELGAVPVWVDAGAIFPIGGTDVAQKIVTVKASYTITTFQLRAFKANGTPLTNTQFTYGYSAFSGPAPPPSSSPPPSSTPASTSASPSPTDTSSPSPSDTSSPSPTDTTSPSGSPTGGNGFPNAGQAINASNTGLAGAGVDESSLVPDATVNYDASFNGQTISGKLYAHRINISGNNITIKDCKVLTGGLDVFGINVTGDGNTVDHCTVTAPAGQSLYEPIFLAPGSVGDMVSRNDISRGENLHTTYGSNAQIVENYLHDNATDSNPSDHPDGIEVYGGGPVVIARNRIAESSPYDSPLNAAPWGSYTLTDMSVVDNFIDGGQEMLIVYNQNSGGFLRNTRVLRNAMGGHTNPVTNMSFGIYKALLRDGRAVVDTEAQLAANPNAILWPTSGVDVNRWEETGSLVPDRTGQVVLSTCPSPC
jgi:hypothetical protein